MINITSRKAKRLYQAEFSRQMAILQNTFVKEVRPLLGRQFFNAANLVQNGVLIQGVNHAVDLGRRRWMELFQKHYKRVASTFSKKTFNIIDRAQKSYELFEQPSLYLEWQREFKGPKDEFWGSINKWANTQAAQKIRLIQQTTKDSIATVIHKGMQEGESHRNIAKRIRKTSAAINPHRARTIALTETHSAAVKSVDVSVASTRIEMEREWVSAKDMRTRRPDKNNIWNHYGNFPLGANGEKVAQDGKFVGTGQALDHPGDPKGSPGNTILCRCVLIYHSVKVQDKLKPYVPEVGPIKLPKPDFKPTFGDWGGKGGINDEGDFVWKNPSQTAKFVDKVVNDLPNHKYGKINPIPRVKYQKLTAAQKEIFDTKNWEIIDAPLDEIVSHQDWIRPLDLVKMTSVDITTLSIEERLPTAVRMINGKIRIVDGNHRAALNLILDEPLQVRLLNSKLPTAKPVVPKWKPTMTEKEVAVWAKDSSFKENIFHGTTADAVEAIKKEGFKYETIGNRTDAGILGKGFYFADDVTVANSYATYSDSLTIRINVKNPLSDEKIFSSLRKEVKESVKIKLGRTPTLSEFSKELADEVQRQGYDAIIYGDGAQVAVFDSKNIAVVIK